MKQLLSVRADSKGFSHLLVPLLVLLLVAVAGTYTLVNSKAATSRSCSTGRRFLDGKCVRVYTYTRLTAAQERVIKKIASSYWYNSCGTNGRKIRIVYYYGPLHNPELRDPYDYVDAINDQAVDAIAYTYLKNQACYIHVNEAAMEAHMKNGVTFSTKRSMCFTITHEVGHVYGRPDYGYGQENQVKTAEDHLMSYYWIDRMEDGREKAVGPAACQAMR